jgi:hypothetical protein
VEGKTSEFVDLIANEASESLTDVSLEALVRQSFHSIMSLSRTYAHASSSRAVTAYRKDLNLTTVFASANHRVRICNVNFLNLQSCFRMKSGSHKGLSTCEETI